MLVLVAYDIQTADEHGRRRLRRVAKICESVGLRVQDSVFECILDAAQLRHLQERIKQEIDPKTDQIRYYNLGNRYENRIICAKKDQGFSYGAPLIL